MKVNFKKLVVMLGIVLGFTLSAGAIIMGWGWFPEGQMNSVQKKCSAIPHAYFRIEKTATVDGELRFYGACVCEMGYIYNDSRKECVPMP